MKRPLALASVALMLALAAGGEASSVTVTGRTGGRIFYDGQEVGTVPLRLTKVPPGQHVVRVVAPGNRERTFVLNYRAGADQDLVIDFDRELAAEREVPAPFAEAPAVASSPFPDDEQLDRVRSPYPFGYQGPFGYPYYDRFSYPYYGGWEQLLLPRGAWPLGAPHHGPRHAPTDGHRPPGGARHPRGHRR